MAVFTWKPAYTYKTSDGWNVLSSKFENGSTQKRLKHRSPKTWSLKFIDALPVIQEIQAFFNARRGSFEPFDWTDPETNTPYTVRFKDDALEIDKSGRLLGSVELTLEEVI